MVGPLTGPTPRAGGCLMAAALLGGAIAGIALGEPSVGVIGGAVVAVGLGIIVWLIDRRGR